MSLMMNLFTIGRVLTNSGGFIAREFKCLKRGWHGSSSVNIRSIFPYHIDNYKAAHFEITDREAVEIIGLEQFESLVVKECGEPDLRAIWFRIPVTRIRLAEPLIKLGFNLHHAKNNQLVLVKSLTKVDNIPKYAYTNIGVGCLVVNEQNEALLVKEVHYYSKPVWKLPGGYVEQGEELEDAAIREVREETGIETEFVTFLMMRQLHKFAFGASDMYFVAVLRPLTTDIVNCEQEISHCEWVNMEQIRPELTDFNRAVLKKYAEWKANPFRVRGKVIETRIPTIPTATIFSKSN